MVTLSDNAIKIMEDRYLLEGETPDELFWRVANAIAEAERSFVEDEGSQREIAWTNWSTDFYNLMSSLKFLPNSPTLVNARTGKGCLSACFVMSPEDNIESIMQVTTDAALTEKWGGGIGFGLSKLRPVNDKISTVHGYACGPLAVMGLYAKVGETLTQGSFRLGAHMGQLHISHPDIRAFIHCKDNDDALKNFNISVQIPDSFMEALKNETSWDLVNPRDGTVVESVSAKELWDELCNSAWKTGDPGVVFIDRVRETQPNPTLGEIQTSNPCGEEFLEDYGNCCLGSVNLAAHVVNGNIDWKELEKTINLAVRFLDDVIEVNTFPVEKQRQVNLLTRRIGLGVMGWADMLTMLDIAYDHPDALKLLDKVGGYMLDNAKAASSYLGKERGNFPLWESYPFKEGYQSMRHSSVTTIAPTGTISRLADVSSGIEPPFALAWKSNILWKGEDSGEATQIHIDAPLVIRQKLEEKLGIGPTNIVLEAIADDPEKAYNVLRETGIDPKLFKTAHDISPATHVSHQAAWQKYTTNSVSKTINLHRDASITQVDDVFWIAYQEQCKAITVYRDGSKDEQVLQTGPLKKFLSIEPRKRPEVLKGTTTKVLTGHGTLYVTVNLDDDESPFEVFATLGKAGSCDPASLENTCRLISLCLRSKVSPSEIVGQMRNITCCPLWTKGYLIKSPWDAISLVLAQKSGLDITPTESIDATAEEITSRKRCHCGGTLIYQEGCEVCQSCGTTKCE